ncbi:hypothetical protein DFH07DRAFT_951475 [Mycena maculata]|uniref:Uncharacterized protein n=1 Tax=Mycena maculata TaxID=230809 RepID=A0AAD7K249_9AGAR|nr:hypothetical protein DFH07DRAFT_951475 [Mycena maculata]
MSTPNFTFHTTAEEVATVFAREIQGKNVVHTNFTSRKDTLTEMKEFGILDENGEPIINSTWEWKTIPEGAATTVAAAFDPVLSDKLGSYLEYCQVANETITPHSSDPANASRVWDATEKLVGQ